MRGQTVQRDPSLTQRVYGKKENASFQIIVLGSSGGPREDTLSGLLVRAPQSAWRKGSMIAVDAGTHLASIIRILQQYMPLQSKEVPPHGYRKLQEDGPFAGINFPGYSARANALYIFRELMHAFLITHPHLDHLSGMGINTPALEYGREAKTIIALDSTIEAIKSHIFNDWIWPNLSDEGSGVGFVTYRRLREGGNVRLGSGDARGYVRICESLATLCMPVTHGKCRMRSPTMPHQRTDSSGWHDGYVFPQRRLSRMSDHDSYFAAIHQHHPHYPTQPATAPFMHHVPGQTTPGYSTAPTPTLSAIEHHDLFEPVKSAAFFILNEETGAEVLIFGDTEPDSVSMSPLNWKVWKSAAPKVANGALRAIFIECSYDDTVRDADLYGHLCPRHLVHELYFLAKEVVEHHKVAQNGAKDKPVSPIVESKRPAEPQPASDGKRKRKRNEGGSGVSTPEIEPLHPLLSEPVVSPYVGKRSTAAATAHRATPSTPTRGDLSPITKRPHSPSRPYPPKHVQFEGGEPHPASAAVLASPILSGTVPSSFHPPPINTSYGSSHEHTTVAQQPLERLNEPLKGLTVHIIHVKDTLVDGPTPGEIIAEQLKAHGAELGLGCDFDVTEAGESIWI